MIAYAILLLSLAMSTIPKCQEFGRIRFPYAYPHSDHLTECTQHDLRTCCTPAHTNFIYNQIQSIQEQYIPECTAISKIILCSPCDADLAQKIKKGLCPSLCQQWYDSCKLNYFTYYGIIDKAIDICEEGKSIVCSKLIDIVNSSTEFCEIMGFKESDTDCFDGTPSAKEKGKFKLPNEKY